MHKEWTDKERVGRWKKSVPFGSAALKLYCKRDPFYQRMQSVFPKKMKVQKSGLRLYTPM